jgi:hypothetical protein
MKLDELKKIIKEELKSILEANAPAKEKETIEAPPTTKPGTTPKRRGFDKPEPGVNPKPKASLEETEKELVSKITARFLKSKK